MPRNPIEIKRLIARSSPAFEEQPVTLNRNSALTSEAALRPRELGYRVFAVVLLL